MDFKERKIDIQKSSERYQLMYDVYYLYKVEHESVTSISQKKSLNRRKVYRILRTFAPEKPQECPFIGIGPEQARREPGFPSLCFVMLG